MASAPPHIAQRSRDATTHAAIQLRDIEHTFRSANGLLVTALRNVSFRVEPGQFVAVVGPSGCGKSTLLNIISGLLKPSRGEALVDGTLISGVRHDVGYMPAHDTLLPWRTVRGNVEFPLEFQPTSRAERRERADQQIHAVGLQGFQDYYPHALSMGMRQRVAIARTFVAGTRIVLMDEPFSALDAQTRVRVQDMFLSIWEREHPTVVLITHDVTEAVALADVVVVFSRAPGSIVSIHTIGLPRPRSVEQLIFDNTSFQQHMKVIWSDLRNETSD